MARSGTRRIHLAVLVIGGLGALRDPDRRLSRQGRHHRAAQELTRLHSPYAREKTGRGSASIFTFETGSHREYSKFIHHRGNS
jgi:hypothetical protein